MNRKMSPITRLLTMIVMLAILISASTVTPSLAQSPASLQAAYYPPSLIFPTSNVVIRRMIYIWTTVSGATQYQIQVYKDTTQILNKTLLSSSACAGGTCYFRHNVDLTNNTAYTWRVRAYVSGAWRAYSQWQAFSVGTPPPPPVTGFYSPFTDNALNWVMHSGAWYLEGSNYFATEGVADYATTISHINDYSTLTFEARMKRIGCAGCANVLAIRGNPTLDSNGWWVSEYTFDYTNTGLFSIWRDSNGTYTALQDWTATSAISQGGWNTLTVIADGPNMKFYINGFLVWSGTDATYPSGRVGIGMYRAPTSVNDKLYVDYAQLDTFAMAGSVENQPLLAGDIKEGGDHNMAP